MIQKTGMTIDAYLQNAGLKPVGTTGRKHFIPLKVDRSPSFSEALASAKSYNPSESIEKKTGLTIADYLNQTFTGTSTGFFRNSTIQDASFHPGRLDMLGQPSLPPKIEHTTATSKFHSRSEGTGASVPLEGEALIADSIKSAARRYNLPEKLIASVIQAESNFQVDAVSPAGAQGLMQLMPATAKELGVDDPFDVRQNIDGGAGYLRQMLDRFGGNVKLALAAYNAGPGTVERYNGNVPYRETQNYIERVLKRVSA